MTEVSEIWAGVTGLLKLPRGGQLTELYLRCGLKMLSRRVTQVILIRPLLSFPVMEYDTG